MPLYTTHAIVIRSSNYGESDKIVTFFTEDFGSGLDGWISNYINDFTVTSGYLEKISIFDRGSYLITNPDVPINYTFEFDALMNIDPSREKFDWIIESDDDFDFGYMYRLYSSTSNELPNTLRLYQKQHNQFNVIIDLEINQEILTGTWYHLETDIYEDSEFVYHTIRFNGEEIFTHEFTQTEYNHRDYLGLRIYSTNQSIIDNVKVYNGTYEVITTVLNPFEVSNEMTNYTQFNNVKYEDNGIIRVEDIIIYEEPYSLEDKDIEISLNLNFNYLLNEFGEKFHLDKYQGIKIGVLLPYNPIISTIEVSILGGEKDSEVIKTINYDEISKIYSTPNDYAVVINNTRMIKTYITLFLPHLSDRYPPTSAPDIDEITPILPRRLI